MANLKVGNAPCSWGTLEFESAKGEQIGYSRMLDELAWEFCQEARRRTDMIRFGVFTRKSWLSHSPNGDYRALYPIPRTEIAKNSNLVQNTGYPAN